jgi:hypothetical protein
MGELREGETCRDHKLKPPPGFYTLASVRDKLGISGAEINVHLKALRIVVGPFVRDEPNVKKVYKNQRRWLTTEEVERIVARVHALRGRSL